MNKKEDIVPPCEKPWEPEGHLELQTKTAYLTTAAWLANYQQPCLMQQTHDVAIDTGI